MRLLIAAAGLFTLAALPAQALPMAPAPAGARLPLHRVGQRPGHVPTLGVAELPGPAGAARLAGGTGQPHVPRALPPGQPRQEVRERHEGEPVAGHRDEARDEQAAKVTMRG